MNELETFHLDLYHARLQYIQDDAGLKEKLWDSIFQNKINALSHGYPFSANQITCYIIAAKNYFGDKISYNDALDVFKQCCISQVDPENKHALTNSFFNRLKLHLNE